MIKRMTALLLTLALMIALVTPITAKAEVVETQHTFLSSFKSLEKRAEEFVASNPNCGYTAPELTLAYLRWDRYNSSAWQAVAGRKLEAFDAYVNQQGSWYKDFKLIDTMQASTKFSYDFIHMIAGWNVGLVTPDALTMATWGGDTAQLVKELLIYPDNYDTLYAKAKEFFGSNLHTFSYGDANADITANIIATFMINAPVTTEKTATNWYTIYNTNYNYNSSTANTDRIRIFVANIYDRFTGYVSPTRDKYVLSSIQGLLYYGFTNDFWTGILSYNNYGIDTAKHQNYIKAVCDVFGEYLYNMYKSS